MKENLNMDKAFREKLEGFSAPPPPHVLNHVMGQMAAVKRKKRIAYVGWISAAAVVVMAFIAGWYLNDSTKELEPAMAETVIEKNKIEANKNRAENRQNNDLTQEAQPTIINEEIKNTTLTKPKDNPLLASTLEENESKFPEETVKENNRFSMDFINRINAVFQKNDQESELKKSYSKVKTVSFSDTEKVLIAENTKLYKPQRDVERGWKIGAHVSPGYSSYEANHSGSYAQVMTNATSNGNGNVGAGFSVQYKTNKRLRVESGVYYAQSGQKSGNSLQLFSRNQEYDLAYAAPENKSMYANAVNLDNGRLAMNSTAGVINFSGTPKGAEVLADVENSNPQFSNSLVSTGEFSQVFDFIEIPLYLRYRLLDSKLGIEVLGGMNAGFVVGNNAYIDNSYGLQNIGSTQDISSTNFSGTVGLGFNYGLGKHFSVALEPRLNYYLNSINKNPEVDFRPYRVGFYTGLYYEF